MTGSYVSENFDSRTEPLSEALIDESVLKPVENSKKIEDIHFCHLVTLGAESNTAQALEVDDSPVTVGDSGDSSRLNAEEIELLEFLEKAVAEKDIKMP